MPDHNVYRLPVLVTLPGEIDLASREHAYDQLYAAVASGARLVIADLSATTFCDGGSLRRLIAVQNRAAAQDVQLRIVIPPGSAVRRLADLIGLDQPVTVFPGVREALVPYAHHDDGPGRPTPRRHHRLILGEPPPAA